MTELMELVLGLFIAACFLLLIDEERLIAGARDIPPYEMYVFNYIRRRIMPRADDNEEANENDVGEDDADNAAEDAANNAGNDADANSDADSDAVFAADIELIRQHMAPRATSGYAIPLRRYEEDDAEDVGENNVSGYARMRTHF